MRAAAFVVCGLLLLTVTMVFAAPARAQAKGQPEYELAYVNGMTVTISAIDLRQVAPTTAQADFYLVVYPATTPLGNLLEWQSDGLAIGVIPLCDPCDHQGDGIDYIDFHDHVLDSMPSTGHSEFSVLWHVFLIIPAYSFGPTGIGLGLGFGNTVPPFTPTDLAVNAFYASHLPLKSEAAINSLLSDTITVGSTTTPVAVEIDTHFYFLCSVVSGNAGS